MIPTQKHFGALLLGLTLTLGLTTSIVAPVPAVAQAGLGSLAGTVTDTSNAVVDGATVTLRNEGLNFERSAQTSSTGLYRFFALPVGAGYTIRVTAPGYKTAELKGISTSVGTTLSADVILQVGSTVDTVEVTATQNVEQVQTETAAISQLIDSEIWQSSPLENRSQNAFVNLTAGATPDDGLTGRGAAVDGARTGSGNFLVDGMDNNDQGLGGGGAVGGGGAITTISPDAIQEYRVISHNLPAEYGRSGGFATDTVLKSGTSHWHGSLFEYNRIQKLAANSWFSKNAGITDHLVRNQFGGSIGGPLYKDRTFFYATYEGHRLRTGSPATYTTTTQDFLNYVKSGAFEKFMEGTADQDPSSGTIGLCPAYLGTTCPGALPHAATLGPVFQKLLKEEPTAFPLGTKDGTPVAQGLYTGGSLQYPVNVYSTTTKSITDALNQNRGSMKIDHKFGDRDQLGAAYLADLFEDNSSNGSQGGSPFGPPGFNIGGAQNFSVSWTHTFSPSLLNIARVGYLRHVSNFDAPSTHGVPYMYTAADPLGEGFGAYSGFPQYFTENEFLYSDSITKTLPKHALKAGFQYIRTRNGSSFYNDIYGTLLNWDVENLVTDGTLYDEFEPLLYDGDSSYGSLYLASGSIDPSTKELPDPYRGFRANELSTYIQDDWKPTPRLTVNLGVRWDYFGPPHNFKKGFDSNVYFGAFGTPNSIGNQFMPMTPLAGGLQGAQFKQKDSQIWNKDTLSIGPRFGFSYDVFGNGKLALRGGFGIGYDRLYNNVYENLRFNPPHFADNSVGYAGNGLPAGALLQPGIYNSPFDANLLLLQYRGKPTPRHIDERLKNAYYEQFNFGFEYQIKAGYVWETNYVGTLGRQLVGLNNINTYAGRTAGHGNSSARITSLFGNDNFRTNGFSSSYSSLQSSLRKGYSNGLQFMANYTYSKALDELSDVFSQRNAATGPQNPYHWAYDYGRADFDMTHNFVMTLNYTTQWKKNNRLLGGWGISPILAMHSGIPFSPYDSAGSYNPLKDGRAGTNRTVFKGQGSPKDAITHSQSPATGYLKPIPDAVKGVVPAGDYFGPYTCPAAQLWCEPPVGRNSISGPAFKNLDLGISKHVTTWEHQGITFQANFFNTFNHPNFHNPVANYNDGNYGKSLSASDPRVTQLSLRYDF